jgi:hypothetical protein
LVLSIEASWMEDRMKRAEDAIRLLAEELSRQGGQIQAIEGAVLGILKVAGIDERVQHVVALEFERRAAFNLGSSTNQPQVDTFAELSSLLLMAMNERRDPPEQGSDVAEPRGGA